MKKSPPICKHWWIIVYLMWCINEIVFSIIHFLYGFKYIKKIKGHSFKSTVTQVVPHWLQTVRLSFESLSIWRRLFYHGLSGTVHCGLPFIYRLEERNCLNRTHSKWLTAVVLPLSSLVRSINLNALFLAVRFCWTNLFLCANIDKIIVHLIWRISKGMIVNVDVLVSIIQFLPIQVYNYI